MTCPSRIELPFSRHKAESGAKWAHFSLRCPRYLNAWKRLESNISNKTENKDFNVNLVDYSAIGKYRNWNPMSILSRFKGSGGSQI